MECTRQSQNVGSQYIVDIGTWLQSVMHSEKTEIDYLNGEIVSLGQRTSTPTPYNSAVVELVHQVEVQHQFVSVKQLAAALNQRRPRRSIS